MKDYGSGKGDAKIMDELAAKLFARFSAPLYWFNGVKPAKFIHDGKGIITSTVFDAEIQNDLAEWWKETFPTDRDFEVVMSEENGSDKMRWQLTHGECPGCCTWGRFEISDGILNSYNGSESFVTIPGSVTKIGWYAFRGCMSLSSVTIPGSVTEIGLLAFEGCTSLSSVTIPDSVTEISKSAFKGCTSLSSVTIPASVTKIGESAFKGCTSLEKIYYTGTKEQWSAIRKEPFGFPNTPMREVRCSDGTVEIPACSIKGGVLERWNCDGSEAVIPEGITEIGVSAFKGCTSLTSVAIPASVTEIDGSPFKDCTSLVSVTIPESVTKIGLSVFEGCTSLGEIHYAGTKGQWTFTLAGFNCIPDITTVYCADGNAERIKDKAEIVIPDGIMEIGVSAFEGCTSLTSVTIPVGVTKIGSSAFEGCTSLVSVIIPATVTKIEWYAFKGCTSLSSVTIPASVMEIGESAFFGCTSLSSVSIPEGVTEIGWAAFVRCTSLGEIHYAGTKGRWTFALAGFNCIPDTATVYCADGVAERINDKTEIVIPDGVTKICWSAFYGCVSSFSVTIPTSVTEISESVFQGYTSLTSVTIPASVMKIGRFAFKGCTSLVEINFGGTEDDWKAISKEEDWNYEVPATEVHCRNGDADINNDEGKEN